MIDLLDLLFFALALDGLGKLSVEIVDILQILREKSFEPGLFFTAAVLCFKRGYPVGQFKRFNYLLPELIRSNLMHRSF